MWSYSGNPATSTTDAVRFEIQDTDPKAELLQDEEIDYALSQEGGSEPSQGDILAAAARCLEVLSRRFAAQADTEEGSLRTTYSKMAITYSQRAVDLRNRASGMNAPWTGGVSRSERRERQDNSDEIQPTFRVDQFNIPYQGQQAQPFPPSSIVEEEN